MLAGKGDRALKSNAQDCGSGYASAERVMNRNADMQIHVERQSVCAGDDVDAPHARSFLMTPNDADDLSSAAIRLVIDAKYLADVEGGSTWIAYSSGIALAVVTLRSDGEAGQMLRTSADLHPKKGAVALRFQYFLANSPARLLCELNAGREPERRWQERA